MPITNTTLDLALLKIVVAGLPMHAMGTATNKHRDFKLRLGELLPVSVAFKTSHTALEADCPGNSGTKQEVPFTKSKLESHSLNISDGVKCF